MSMPAVIESSAVIVTENDLSAPAACRSLAVHLLLSSVLYAAHRSHGFGLACASTQRNEQRSQGLRQRDDELRVRAGGLALPGFSHTIERIRLDVEDDLARGRVADES